MAVRRCQIPFSFEYPDGTGKMIPAPLGTQVMINDRNTLAVTTVYAGETGASTIASPATDAAGSVPGWVVQGSYTLSAAANGGASPPYSGQVIAWDAVRGDGVEAIYPNTVVLSHLHPLVTPLLIPTGAIFDHAGGSAPTGFLLCDGASYATATYPNLFAVHGYTFGGTGANFNVPDCRGRMHIGSGTGVGGGTSGTGKPTGSALTARSLSAWGGTETYALGASDLGQHSHVVSDPSHGHGYSDPGHTHSAFGTTSGISANHYHFTNSAGRFVVNGGGANDGTLTALFDTGGFTWTRHASTGTDTADHSHGGIANWTTVSGMGHGVAGAVTGISTLNTGSGTAHTVQQPVIAVNKIIKT